MAGPCLQRKAEIVLSVGPWPDPVHGISGDAAHQAGNPPMLGTLQFGCCPGWSHCGSGPGLVPAVACTFPRRFWHQWGHV